MQLIFQMILGMSLLTINTTTNNTTTTVLWPLHRTTCVS